MLATWPYQDEPNEGCLSNALFLESSTSLHMFLLFIWLLAFCCHGTRYLHKQEAREEFLPTSCQLLLRISGQVLESPTLYTRDGEAR